MTDNNNHSAIEVEIPFPAKILLFGEYNLVLGQSGFLIPFQSFSGFFTFKIQNCDFATTSNRALLDFASFLKDNHNLGNHS